ncbi:MAG: hypothetical protein AABY86_15780, partial [Bdellovibrionota bacterium]
MCKWSSYFVSVSLMGLLNLSVAFSAVGTSEDAALMGDDYFKIASVEMERVVAPHEVMDEYLAQERSDSKNLGEVIMVVDQLIALGKKIWVIIEAG